MKQIQEISTTPRYSQTNRKFFEKIMQNQKNQPQKRTFISQQEKVQSLDINPIDYKSTQQFQYTLDSNVNQNLRIRPFRQLSVQKNVAIDCQPLINPASQRFILKPLQIIKTVAQKLQKSNILNINFFQLPALKTPKSVNDSTQENLRRRSPQCSTFYKIKQARNYNSFFGDYNQKPPYINESIRYSQKILDNTPLVTEERSQIEISPLTDTHLKIQQIGSLKTTQAPRKNQTKITIDLKSTRKIMIFNQANLSSNRQPISEEKIMMSDSREDDDADLGTYLQSLTKC